MRLATRAVSAILVAVVVPSCKGADSNFVRGRGLSIATVSAPARARIYEAAVRGAFEIDESLWLLLDGRLLALRSTGLRFPELPLVPFTTLPGRTLGRERQPLTPH